MVAMDNPITETRKIITMTGSIIKTKNNCRKQPRLGPVNNPIRLKKRPAGNKKRYRIKVRMAKNADSFRIGSETSCTCGTTFFCGVIFGSRDARGVSIHSPQKQHFFAFAEIKLSQ
jgi:hypothetical protein